MKATPITQEQLNAWSESYNASEARQVATLALSKTDLKDAIFAGHLKEFYPAGRALFDGLKGSDAA